MLIYMRYESYNITVRLYLIIRMQCDYKIIYWFYLTVWVAHRDGQNFNSWSWKLFFAKHRITDNCIAKWLYDIIYYQLY